MAIITVTKVKKLRLPNNSIFAEARPTNFPTHSNLSSIPNRTK
jgi:hypothetical protein